VTIKELHHLGGLVDFKVVPKSDELGSVVKRHPSVETLSDPPATHKWAGT